MSGLSALLAASLVASAPAQEPSPRGVVHHLEGAVEGYTLLAPLTSKTTYLIDMQGEVVHTWEDDRQPGFAVYLMPDGRLLRLGKRRSPGFVGPPQGGILREFDWDGNKTWEFAFDDGDLHLHHDLAPLPNGNVLLIAWDRHGPEEARAAGRLPDLIAEEGLWTTSVIEVRPTRPEGGEVVWRWNAWDHLVQDQDPEAPNYGRPSDHPGRLDLNVDRRERIVERDLRAAERERQLASLGYGGGSEEEDDQDGHPTLRFGASTADWLHMNAVEHLAAHDLIVLSSRHLSEVLVIDHSTTTEQAAGSTGGRFGRGGDLLFRLGRPTNHGGQGEQLFFGQHDARFEVGADGGLSLTVFNNGVRRGWSSAEQFRLPFDPQAGFVGSAELEWVWSAPQPRKLFSPAVSGAQRLPGGNFLICSGTQGRVLEVTPGGDLVWDFENPFGAPPVRELEGDIPPPPGTQLRRAGPAFGGRVGFGLFRATRIPAGDPRLARLR